MAGSDGSIIIDVLLNTDQMDKAVSKTESQAKSKFSRMGDSVKGFGKAVAVGAAAVAGLGAALVALAAPFVSAAGAANALNAQFDEVFKDMRDKAIKNLNDISKETGIMPERLKGSFVQMAAFAKTTGVNTAGALDLTSRATLAAADSAAFYDRSIESVTESLQSFLKGNFENDAALGISATETTRNAAANKLYGKSFIDLAEDQKQLTLLQMVEDGNKLSGALGQAARETDGLENVLGNLKQAWENLKVTIGNMFFDRAIVALKGLTNVMANIPLGWLEAAFQDLFTVIGILGNAIGGFFSAAWEKFGGIITHTGMIIGGFFVAVYDGLRYMAKAFNDNLETIARYVYLAIDQMYAIIKPFADAFYTAFVYAANMAVEAWNRYSPYIIDGVKMTFEFLKDVYVAYFSFVADVVLKGFQGLQSLWDKYGGVLVEKTKKVIVTIEETVLRGFELIQKAVVSAVTFVRDFWDANGNAIVNKTVQVMSAIGNFIWSYLQQAYQFVVTGVTTIKDFWNANSDEIVDSTVQTMIDVKNAIVDAMVAIYDYTKEKLQQIKDFWDQYGQLIIDGVVFVYNYIYDFLEDLLTDVVKFVGEQLAKIKKFWDENGAQLMEALRNFMIIIAGILAATVPVIMFIIEVLWDGIKKVISGALDIILGLIKIFIGIFTLDFSKMWEGVKNIFTGAIDLILGIVTVTFVGGIRNLVVNFAKAIPGLIRSMWDNIVSIFTTMVKSPVTYIAIMAVELLKTLDAMVLNAVAYLKDMATKMVDAVKSLPGKFLQVGKDIGQGLIDGIKSLNPVKYVKNLAGDMVDGAKGILKIFSPSRVFRSIGNDTMRGWIIGMEDYEDAAPKALIDSMGFEDVVKNGASVLDLMGNINGLGSNYTIGVGGLLTPMSVGAATGYSNNVTNNNGNTSSIVINGQTDVNEIERLQRRMQFGF